MAADAPFADVDVAAEHFERGVGLDAGEGGHVRLDQIERDDLDQAADQDAPRW
jgi:hypothetical protein